MAAPWQPIATGYRLGHFGLKGDLVLRGTSPGLRKVSSGFGNDRARWPGPLLAVSALQATGGRPFKVTASPQSVRRWRGNLIDIQIEQSPRCPARLQLYWRAATKNQLDMEVLVTTTEPFERLEVTTLTEVPTSDVFIRSLGSGPGWINATKFSELGIESLVVPRDHHAGLISLDGRPPSFTETAIGPPFLSPLVLYRPREQDWSYAEMSHPDDCFRIIAVPQARTTQVSFGLFGLDTEKGVILRGRVRGAFIPRRGDSDRANRLFTKFIAEPPHLSV